MHLLCFLLLERHFFHLHAATRAAPGKIKGSKFGKMENMPQSRVWTSGTITIFVSVRLMTCPSFRRPVGSEGGVSLFCAPAPEIYQTKSTEKKHPFEIIILIIWLVTSQIELKRKTLALQEPTEKSKDSGPLLSLSHLSFLSLPKPMTTTPKMEKARRIVGAHLKKFLLYPTAIGKPTGRIYY